MSEIKQILHLADPSVHATDECISAYYIYLVLFKAFQALVEYVTKQFFVCVCEVMSNGTFPGSLDAEPSITYFIPEYICSPCPLTPHQ